MMLARGIKLATNVAKNALLQLSRPARLPEWYGSAIANNDYYAVARSVTGDDALSHILSEMIELLGKHAHIHVESYLAPYLEREYLDGGIWAASLASPYLSTSPGEAIQHECHIAVFNGVISTIDQIYPILRSLENREQKNILIVATKIHDNALNTIVATHQKGEIKIVAATLTSAGLKVLQDFQDLALLSGATLFSQEAGETLECFNETHLGWARRVELNGTELLLAGGRGEPERIQKEIENIQTMQKSSVAENDDEGRLQARLARLSGSTGVLKIGAHSENQRALLRQKAEQAIKVLQGVTFDGIAPGGGTAYLHCLPALQALVHSSLDVTMGIRAVQRALKAPFLKILENAGIDGAEYYCDLISSLPPGAYFDVVERKVVSAEEVSLFDPARMLSVALETAASSAMMVLNTDAIILKRNPIVSYEP
jgi:chaperonin GroEL